MNSLEQALIEARPTARPTVETTQAVLEAALSTHRAASHRRTAKRRAVRVVAVLAGAALIAGPSYAIVTHFVDFHSEPRAPSLIQKRFRDLTSGAPPSMDPRVIDSETRLVTVFDLPSRRVPLWVAPTRTGGFCEAFGDLGGGCITDRNFPGAQERGTGYRPWLLSASLFGFRDLNQGIKGTYYLSGSVLAQGATRLELTLGDGSVRALPLVWVSPPIEAGFFLTELPSSPTTFPAVLNLFDNTGRLLSRSEPLLAPGGPRAVATHGPGASARTVSAHTPSYPSAATAAPVRVDGGTQRQRAALRDALARLHSRGVRAVIGRGPYRGYHGHRTTLTFTGRPDPEAQWKEFVAVGVFFSRGFRAAWVTIPGHGSGSYTFHQLRPIGKARFLRIIRAAAQAAHVRVLQVASLKPNALAPIVTIEAKDPATFLRRGLQLQALFGGAHQRVEGVFLIVKDPEGHVLLRGGMAVRIGAGAGRWPGSEHG